MENETEIVFAAPFEDATAKQMRDRSDGRWSSARLQITRSTQAPPAISQMISDSFRIDTSACKWDGDGEKSTDTTTVARVERRRSFLLFISGKTLDLFPMWHLFKSDLRHT